MPSVAVRKFVECSPLVVSERTQLSPAVVPLPRQDVTQEPATTTVVEQPKQIRQSINATTIGKT
jgi:hypothetical protein